jgi:hypothetical protein
LADIDITLVEDPATVEFIESIIEDEARDDGATTSNTMMLISNIAAVSSTNQALRKILTNLYENDTGCQILVNLLQTADAVGFVIFFIINPLCIYIYIYIYIYIFHYSYQEISHRVLLQKIADVGKENSFF